MLDPKDCEECGHSYCYECISILNCPFGCKTKSIKNTSAYAAIYKNRAFYPEGVLFDGIAVCNYMGQEIEVPVEMLSEDQMKKEE